MSRNKKTPFRPWESTYDNGIEKRYIRIADTLMCSAAFLSLEHISVNVFIHMIIEAAGKKEFKFPHTKYSRIVSNNGFQAALKDLVDKGFVDVVEHNANLRQANLYAFSDRWKCWKNTN